MILSFWLLIIFRPSESIARKSFSNWQEPLPWLFAKYLSKIFIASNIKNINLRLFSSLLISLPFHLSECSLILKNKSHMIPCKSGDWKKNSNLKNNNHNSDCSVNRSWRLLFDNWYQFINNEVSFLGKNKYDVDCQIKQKKNEKFPIVKSHTIIYPWTVMIHVQNTFFTCWTMMSSLSFKIMTQ